MESIYLKRGESLIIRAIFKDSNGDPIVLDGTWEVSSAMRAKNKCCTTIDLNPVISDGGVDIVYSTDDLESPCYEIDLIAKQTYRTISDTFQLILGNTITPLI
jgi:hypothetical protein